MDQKIYSSLCKVSSVSFDVVHINEKDGNKKCRDLSRKVSSFLFGIKESDLNDNHIRKVLRAHLHGVMAHVYPPLHSPGQNHNWLREKGKAIFKYLEDNLTTSVVSSRTKKNHIYLLARY